MISLLLLPSQPLPGNFNLSDIWVSVIPEGEEFLVMGIGIIIPLV